MLRGLVRITFVVVLPILFFSNMGPAASQDTHSDRELKLTAQVKNRGVNLSWTWVGSKPEEISRYLIYRQKHGQETPSVFSYPAKLNQYRDTNLDSGATYDYWVIALSEPSTRSNRVTIKVSSGGHGPTLLTDLEIFAGVAILGVIIHNIFDHSGQVDLSKDGPQLPGTFTSSDFHVTGLVKGNWSVVVDYELARPASISLDVSDTAHPNIDPAYMTLDGTPGRHVAAITLPQEFGSKEVTGIVHLHADESVTDPQQTPLMKIHEISCGVTMVNDASPKLAVFRPGGFRAFDNDTLPVTNILFDPDSISTDQKGISTYSMQFLADFDAVKAEFLDYSYEDQTVKSSKPVKTDSLNSVGAGQVVNEKPPWDGCTNGHSRPGVYLLAIRAWRINSGQDRGWVIGFSDNFLQVTK